MAGTFMGWVPEDYLDEVCSPCRETPNAWLLLGDTVRLAAFENRDDAKGGGRVLAEGDVVRFCSLTDYGTLTVTIAADGTFAGDAAPAGAESFWRPGDPDTLADSLEAFCKAEVEMADLGEAPGEVTVGAYTWCDGKAFALRGGAFVEVK